MPRKPLSVILLLLIAITFALSGCSDFDEMKSTRLLMRAEALMQQGHEEEASQFLAVLVAQYPRTQSGSLAGQYLERMRRQQEQRARRAFAEIIESYQQVLSGYHAVYATYPASLATLDQSGYFFDAAYLNDITPQGYQVFLSLESDGSGYRLWCVNQGQPLGYSSGSANPKLVAFDRDGILSNIKSAFQADDWNGKLVVLQRKS